MAFNLRSGNKSSFKNIGSSPAKETPPMSASTKKKKWYVDNYEENKDKPGFQDSMNKVFGGETTMDGMTSTTTKKSPATQKVEKGQGKLIKGNKAEPAQNWPGETEGQDENKIFNSKGEHVGDWVDGKKVMHTKKPSKPHKPSKASKSSQKHTSWEGEWISNPPKKKKKK